MKIFYGWIIVGAGIVVTCIGMGAMLSLGIFLQPIATGMGWSRTGISTVSLLNFLSMGVGSFLWGALSDRFGTRSVVLCGGVLLGVGLSPGSFGWDGGFSTSGYCDPHEDMVGILLIQRMMTSPSGFDFHRDFWTLAYQAIDD